MAFPWRKIYCSAAGISCCRMSFIPSTHYKKIIQTLPILCVDVILKNSSGKYLLIKRKNEPYQGQWWVIGGRVHKGETLQKSALRKVREEIGLNIKTLSPVGHFEHTSQANPFGLKDPYHVVSVVFVGVINRDIKVKLDEQSTHWKFSKKLPKDFRIKKF